MNYRLRTSATTTAAAATLMLGLLLAGCATAEPPAGSAPSGPASSAGASPASPSPASPSPTPSASTPTSPSPTESSAAASLTIDITVANGKVTPSGKKIDVDRGQEVELRVTSDTDDEIHAHTGGDGFELEVQAGKTVRGSFTLDSPGSFEVESHHLGKTIVILNVR